MKAEPQHQDAQSRTIESNKGKYTGVYFEDNRDTAQMRLIDTIQRAQKQEQEQVAKAHFVDNRDTVQMRLIDTIQRARQSVEIKTDTKSTTGYLDNYKTYSENSISIPPNFRPIEGTPTREAPWKNHLLNHDWKLTATQLHIVNKNFGGSGNSNSKNINPGSAILNNYHRWGEAEFYNLLDDESYDNLHLYYRSTFEYPPPTTADNQVRDGIEYTSYEDPKVECYSGVAESMDLAKQNARKTPIKKGPGMILLKVNRAKSSKPKLPPRPYQRPEFRSLESEHHCNQMQEQMQEQIEKCRMGRFVVEQELKSPNEQSIQLDSERQDDLLPLLNEYDSHMENLCKIWEKIVDSHMNSVQERIQRDRCLYDDENCWSKIHTEMFLNPDKIQETYREEIQQDMEVDNEMNELKEEMEYFTKKLKQESKMMQESHMRMELKMCNDEKRNAKKIRNLRAKKLHEATICDRNEEEKIQPAGVFSNMSEKEIRRLEACEKACERYDEVKKKSQFLTYELQERVERRFQKIKQRVKWLKRQNKYEERRRAGRYNELDICNTKIRRNDEFKVTNPFFACNAEMLRNKTMLIHEQLQKIDRSITEIVFERDCLLSELSKLAPELIVLTAKCREQEKSQLAELREREESMDPPHFLRLT